MPGSDDGGGNTPFAERLGKTAHLSRLAVRLVWLVSPGLALGIVALVYVIYRVPWAARVGRRPAATPEKHNIAGSREPLGRSVAGSRCEVMWPVPSG